MAKVTELKKCPLCGGDAEFESIKIGGTGASGMEAPDWTCGCPACDLWLGKERGEVFVQGRGMINKEHEAKEQLAYTWNNRHNC